MKLSILSKINLRQSSMPITVFSTSFNSIQDQPKWGNTGESTLLLLSILSKINATPSCGRSDNRRVLSILSKINPWCSCRYNDTNAFPFNSIQDQRRDWRRRRRQWSLWLSILSKINLSRLSSLGPGAVSFNSIQDQRNSNYICGHRVHTSFQFYPRSTEVGGPR